MINNTRWMTYMEYLPIELKQSAEEGKDIKKYVDIINKTIALTDQQYSFEEREEKALDILNQIEKETIKPGYEFQEPDELKEIFLLRDEQHKKTYNVLSEDIKSKISGAWLGRCIGCLLGQPIEGWKRNRIVGFLKDTKNYPIKHFMSSDVDDEIIERYQVSNNGENAFCDTVTHWINNITDMPEDDDTNYTVIGLKVLELYGKHFDSENVAETWLTSLPMGHVSTSERVAYRNIGNLIDAPKCGWWKNPYREWIGAQIRGDIFGYVSPGNPEEAARMAWTDGRISHVKNGIYGEMFIAAMLAAAYCVTEPLDLINDGLGQIPSTSRLYKKGKEVLKMYQDGKKVDETIEWLHQNYSEDDEHQWCHTITNALVVAISLLYSEGDFEKALHIAIECGFDTDCNGATVGSIMGMLLGEEKIPENWKAGLTGVLRTGVAGFHQITINELVERTYKLISK